MVLSEHEALVYSWSGFSDYVRHKGRYLFLATAREKETWDEPHAVSHGRERGIGAERLQLAGPGDHP
jgi:hypothetical protein